MTNAYASVSDLKSPNVLNISGTGYDTRIKDLAQAVSRLIDRYCNRHFWVLDATKRFDGDGTGVLLVPDLLSVASLKTDDDGDRAFETAWDSADYLLYPLNAEPSMPWGRPYTRVLADSAAGGKRVFTRGRQTVQIQGKWGFRDAPRDSLANVRNNARFSATSTTLDVTQGYRFAVGQTILIEEEQLYVTSIFNHTLTVQRGVNGTSPAAHADGVDVSIYTYPAEVVETCLVQAVRLWKRKDSRSTGAEGADSSPSQGLDPDVRHLLSAYRKPFTGGAAW